MTYAPYILLFCVTYYAIWSNHHRRRLERDNAKLRSQIVDLIAPPSLAPINEIEARLALRKQCREAGGVFHIRSA
jgi:S-methylmethionine-dependent homocysteine/selenocysteine methylase